MKDRASQLRRSVQVTLSICLMAPLSACLHYLPIFQDNSVAYHVSCDQHHDQKPLRAGVLRADLHDKDHMRWIGTSGLPITSDPVEYPERRQTVSNYGRRDRAETACQAHMIDYPGHECKIDERAYPVDNMG